MEASLGPLLPLFERERAAGTPLAVGVLVHTAGSTYRKAGALMLIAANGDYSGLLSGGCLEGDLRQHAVSVIETGEPRIVSYDMRGPDDLLWGLGLGCEGAMQILLFRVGPEQDWQPLTHLTASLATHSPTAIGIVTESADPGLPKGAYALPAAIAVSGAVSEAGAARGTDTPSGPVGPVVAAPGAAVAPGSGSTSAAGGLAGTLLSGRAVQAALAEATRTGRVGWVEGSHPAWKLFVLPLSLPPKLLLLGAGPDAAPVVDFAARLNWKVTLVDHRPAYAQTAHFPAAERVVLARPDELLQTLDVTRFSAAVVMSHHLPSDLAYLRALAETAIPYVGLLGPAIRREKLLTDLGPQAQRLRSRLRAPVGLPLGGRTPESIALAIVAEIHAFVHGV